MKTVLVCLALASASAFAHIENGQYKGQTSDGSACEMNVVEQFYEKNVHHPLSERVRVQVNGEEFIVGHPPGADEANSRVTFDHDRFQGYLPNKAGAKALIISMSHAQGHEGPTDFTVIDHAWKNKDGASIRCSNLKR